MTTTSAPSPPNPPPPSSTPPEPITIADAAQVLVDQSWAPSYEEAQADLEAARAQLAERAGIE